MDLQLAMSFISSIGFSRGEISVFRNKYTNNISINFTLKTINIYMYCLCVCVYACTQGTKRGNYFTWQLLAVATTHTVSSFVILKMATQLTTHVYGTVFMERDTRYLSDKIMTLHILPTPTPKHTHTHTHTCAHMHKHTAWHCRYDWVILHFRFSLCSGCCMFSSG
jgi:hypothetical protein